MLTTKRQFTDRQKLKRLCLEILFIATLAICAAAAFFLTRNAFSASGILPDKSTVQPDKSNITAAPINTPLAQIPPQTQAARIKIIVGTTQNVPVNTEINSVVVVTPEIASAQIKNVNSLTITGLKIGETILIVSDSRKRQTFIIEVTGKPTVSERQNTTSVARGTKTEKAKTSGLYNVLYVQGFDRNPSLLKQNIEFRRQLSEEKTLRISGEIFTFTGNDKREQSFAAAQNFGFDRLSVGIDFPEKTIDFLDSQINVSPLSFNNYPMRGFHLATTPESPSGTDLLSKGIEVFAGLARPSLAFYDDDQGRVAGAVIPVAKGQSWQARAGFITVVPEKNNRFGDGGTVLLMTGAYTPDKKISADGEMAFSSGELSLRARLDLKLRQFGAFGEIIRFDKNSPLNSIGAQPGGRRSEAMSFYWRPDSHFNASVSYNHTAITRRVNSGLADFNRSTFLANAGYRFNRDARLFFRFLDQQIETAVPGSALKFQIAARTVTAGHNIRFNHNWANSVEARINFSREANAGAELENGFSLIEQLRFSWKRNSATGFFNYTYKTPSLTSLVVRNPQLLPPSLQSAFILDPARFLQVYRDRLASLLPGIELPLTRSLDAGIRFQTNFSRFTLSGETRYNAGEILSRNQKNLFAFVGLNVRLDAANSFQINGWRSFGNGGQAAVTFSYTHRFGVESRDGFQFSKLFGFDRGRIQGRVYYDLNSNGQDDAGEPGTGGITVRLDEKRSVMTDVNGRYQFNAGEGGYNISLVSDDLGSRLRASTATQRQVSLSSGQTINVNFGVIDYGFVGGCIFNDTNLSGKAPSSNLHGLKNVLVRLRSSDVKPGGLAVESVTDSNGTYEFRNLRPGNYTLEIDAMTLPVNFRLPAETSRTIAVLPLRGFYFDIPVAAQRAVTGIVFIDRDGDGRFSPQKEEPVEGATIISGNNSVAVSDSSGAYVLRNLPAGKIKLIARAPRGVESFSTIIELGVEPVTKREVNLVVQR
jgi:archaellum component FlaG (FlaF/FlaG flagellin family)